ncbi:MAG: glycoside hydrolase family 57 protein [Planctomycetes bacterium]|nr:glycoside hydrolase family 57 protein [Planctomycetota bacterium]
MTSVVLYFHVHQPFRLRREYSFFDIARNARYFDEPLNEKIVRRVAERSYVPTTNVLRRAVERTDGRFRVAVSITGTVLDQWERWAPEALDAFRALVATGGAELVAETSHHSLASEGDEAEFRAQVAAHTARLKRTFGVAPKSFRNTELVFSDRAARVADDLGFSAILAEGAKRLLRGRSTYSLHHASGCDRVAVLTRSYKHSDDIAFRFADRQRSGNPLTPAEFAGELAAVPARAQAIGLFMDFETAGEHQHESSGILRFFDGLPEAILATGRLDFATPSEAAARYPRRGTVQASRPVSWADQERDLSAWLGNDMQQTAHGALYDLLPAVRASGRADLMRWWRRLSTSDHVYYMCTKHFSDGDVHKYFSPYDAPHTAFVAFMNAVEDLRRRAAVEPRRRRPSRRVRSGRAVVARRRVTA